MAVNMIGFDIYFRITDNKTKKENFTQHRVWDSDMFTASELDRQWDAGNIAQRITREEYVQNTRPRHPN